MLPPRARCVFRCAVGDVFDASAFFVHASEFEILAHWPVTAMTSEARVISRAPCLLSQQLENLNQFAAFDFQYYHFVFTTCDYFSRRDNGDNRYFASTDLVTFCPPCPVSAEYIRKQFPRTLFRFGQIPVDHRPHPPPDIVQYSAVEQDNQATKSAPVNSCPSFT